ncbi:MAG TPA: rhomboid family intramembrane serine protease, partial [Bryobacteraceae bacterium]|nr:rhomboid family intramembrane serine protease [Bryobacteraceae bacterium]
CHEPVGQRVYRPEPSGVLGGFIPHARFNTILILVVNLGMYLITAIYSMKSGRGNAIDIDGQTLVEFGAKWAEAIRMGEWWRLVTAGFLHGGLLHILMNMWVLFDLGAQVEEVYGASRMWVIYLLSNICGFYVSAVWNPYSPSVGASAALFGLIGAMIAMGVKQRNAMGAAIRGLYVRWAIYGLLFSLIPGIDMAAHVGGIVSGFAIAWVAGTPRGEGSRAEPLWRMASWACILIAVVSFVEMYLAFSAAV